MPDAFEDRFESVVIFGRDGIELVVVTTGAVDRDPQKGLTDGADKIFQFFLPHPGLHDRAGLAVADLVPGTGDEEPGGNDTVPTHGFQHIPRNLLSREQIIGLVGIETPDHIVPVTPGIRPELVPLKPLAFTVADDIEPMPRPAFTVAGGGQKSLDQLCGGGPVTVRIRHEGLGFFRSGRQPVQIKSEPPNEEASVRWGIRFQPAPGQL